MLYIGTGSSINWTVKLGAGAIIYLSLKLPKSYDLHFTLNYAKNLRMRKNHVKNALVQREF